MDSLRTHAGRFARLSPLFGCVAFAVVTPACRSYDRCARDGSQDPPNLPLRRVLEPTTFTAPRVPRAGVGPAAAAAAAGAIRPLPEWESIGPAPAFEGQVEGIERRPIVGAVRALAPHPSNPDILYVGTVNGGVWRTDQARLKEPDWRALTDDQPSLSIGALEFDRSNSAGDVLVAATGRFSSLLYQGGEKPAGVLRTTDGGNSWVFSSDSNLFVGESFSVVAARGDVLLAGSSTGSGMFRSPDTGRNWESVSGSAVDQLPAGAIADLAWDTRELNRFYCAVLGKGVFRTDDVGKKWKRVAGEPAELRSASNDNVRLACSPGGRLYVGIAVAGRIAWMGYVVDPLVASPVWVVMATPSIHEGGQAARHFSVTADPANDETVYVGGDRQKDPFPNPLGANDFTATLWRGDGTKPAAGTGADAQWESLTHDAAGGTAPHADSRDLAFDAAGRLLECDDGGVYAHPNGKKDGAWVGLHGDLACTEFHHIVWDARAKIAYGPCQDTGTLYQLVPGKITWQSLPANEFPQLGVYKADGCIAACDDMHVASKSIRYVATQNLDFFSRQLWTVGNAFDGESVPALHWLNPPPWPYDSLQHSFYPALKLNAVRATGGLDRLILSAENGVFESTDGASTIRRISEKSIGDGAGIDPVIYGGRRQGVDNVHVLYFGSRNELYVRTAAPPAIPRASAAFASLHLPTDRDVRDIAVDPEDWQHAFVTNGQEVLATPDAGSTWSKVTGNLGALGGSDLWSLEFVRGAAGAGLVVGTGSGVFSSPDAFSGKWKRLGRRLPNAIARTLAHSAVDDVLVVGLFGRGAWTLRGIDAEMATLAKEVP